MWNFHETIPAWLDTAFFQKILRNYYHNDTSIQVQSFDIRSACQPGEHFTSAIFKVSVKYSRKDRHIRHKSIKLLIKTYPEEDGFKKDLLKASPIFRNEIQMYSTILPEMERILNKNVEVEEKTKLAPNFVYGPSLDDSLDPFPVIVLEDVGFQGFETFDGFGVNEFEVITTVVKKLAKFHGASMQLQENVRGFCG